MKILVIGSLAESLVNFRGHLLAAFSSLGLEVHVAAPGLSRSGPVAAALSSQGYVLHDFPMQRTGANPLADAFTFWALLTLMRKVRPDVVFAYTIKPVVYGTLAAWLASVPRRFALITGVGYAFVQMNTVKRKWVGWIAQALYKISFRRVDKVFFQNHDDEALFRSLGILSSATPSVVVHGSGIDIAFFSPVRPIEFPPIFLMIARLLGDKGVREYAAAAKRVKSKYPQAMFYLVGWIDENPDAISRAELEAWSRAGILNFLGRLQDVRPAIEQCSVYVLPSYREGTPRTVLEAMAMGRPIITTDVPGCRETVADGDNGFLVPSRNVDALVEAMERFIKDPDLIPRMGARSRKIAEEKYDVHKVNAVMLREMGLI